MIEIRPRLTEDEYKIIQDYRKAQSSNAIRNVLVIPDLHSPFIHEKALDHCVKTYEQFNCNQVIFLGDILDNHYSSFHETSPDGMGAGDELDMAIKQLSPWYDAFPKAKVMIGNHDRIIQRKTFTGGISQRWIKSYNEVIGCPTGWEFMLSYEQDGVLYFHGEMAANTLQVLLNKRMNCVYGHLHTKFEILYNASPTDLLWAMPSGCMIDIKKYAFEYAKYNVKRPILGCSVVLNNGTLPILSPLQLK